MRACEQSVLETVGFLSLIIYMKKLLDSDWLRAVQLKCNISAKSVTSQVTQAQYKSMYGELWFRKYIEFV